MSNNVEFRNSISSKRRSYSPRTDPLIVNSVKILPLFFDIYSNLSNVALVKFVFRNIGRLPRDAVVFKKIAAVKFAPVKLVDINKFLANLDLVKFARVKFVLVMSV